MNKINVAVLFGGVSSEHEISLLTANSIISAIPKDKYNVYPVGITKDGRWLYCPSAQNELVLHEWEKKPDNEKTHFTPDATIKGLICEKEIIPIDVVFPALHGKGGEDGTVQGLLTMAKIPFVGCGVLASAVCMDKIIANHVMDSCGIMRCEWDFMTRADMADLDNIEKRVSEKLKYPIFVKPSNAGSSVGVSKAVDKAELKKAVELAFLHDNRVIFERFVAGREVECAVMGNDSPFASLPGEIIASKEFYNYEDKYIAGTSLTHIPASLPPQTLTEIQNTAIYAYKSLSCEGLARVDFFVEANTGRVLLNEVNTMPGFTAISMYPKLMMAYGMTYSEITDKLLTLAILKHGGQNG